MTTDPTTNEATVPLRISLLGPPRIEVDDAPLVVDTRKAVALAAYLAVVGRPIARDSLVELLWPEADADGGRGALRRTLSALRSALGGRWLEIDRQQVRLLTDGVEIDVTAFRRLAQGDGVRELAMAAELYRGDFLEGFSLRDSPTFDAWHLLEAEALRGELARVLGRLVTVAAAAGDRGLAERTARRLVAVDPLDEPAHARLIRLLLDQGDHAAAVRQYRDCARILAAELGVEPSAPIVALYEEARLGAEGRVTASAPDIAPVLVPPVGPARTIAEVASMLGDEVDLELVREMSGLDGPTEAAAYADLLAAGLLREPQAGEPSDRYLFHPAQRAAVLASVGVGRRADLRRRAAAARGRAGDAARAEGDHGRAAGHYEAALSLGHRESGRLLEALGDVETRRGRYGAALASYERAATLVAPSDVPRLEHRLGTLHLRRGATELAELHLRASLALLSDQAASLRSRVLADLSVVAMRVGDADGAAALAADALAQARVTADATAEAQALNLLGMLARRRGALAEARRLLRGSVEAAVVGASDDARLAALNNLALVERSADRLDVALDLTDEALRLARIIGDRHREAALRNNRADLLHALGRREDAQAELLQAVQGFTEVGDQRGHEPEIWKLVEW